MKHWQVTLIIEATAYVDARDRLSASDITELTCDMIRIEAYSEEIELEMDKVRATDVAEVTQ